MNLSLTFLYPSILWALLFAVIPVILHLLNLRKFKTVYFSNVDLLQSIKEETNKTRNIKNWLILLFRVLFLVFLVFAFAFPVWEEQKIKQEEVVSLYIDNSLSMDANGIEGNKLENAKAFADQIIKSLSPNGKVHLITNDFDGNHQIELNKFKAQEEVSKIQPSAISRSFDNILDRQSLFFQNKNYQPQVFWISDFQQLAHNKMHNPDSFDINLSLLRSVTAANISIDSVWFESPVRKKRGTEALQFKITNHGEELIKNIKVSLKINNRINAISIDQLSHGTHKKVFEYQVPNDTLIEGEISIQDENLLFDNKMLFSYIIPKQQKVYLITSKQNNIKAIVQKVFGADSSVVLTTSSPANIDFNELNYQDLIILGELNEVSQSLIVELEKLTKSGKVVAVFPGNNINIDNYQNASIFWGGSKFETKDTSRVEIGSILKEHSFFAGVFEPKEIRENKKEAFPSLSLHYSIAPSERAESIIFKENGTPFLVASNNFYLFASGLSKEHSNFAQKALIVPLLYQMLFKAIHTTPIQYFISPGSQIHTPNQVRKSAFLLYGQQQFKVRIQHNHCALPPEANEGHYKLMVNNAAVSAFSLNQTREESKTIQNQINLLNELEKSPHFSSLEISGNQSSNSSSIANQNGSLWLNCLIFALIFLFLEMIFIRIKF